MRCRSILLPLAAILATACNRDVTAPRALEIANDAEHQLWTSWNKEVLGPLAMMEPASNIGWPDPDRSKIAVVKDGATEQFNAVVIERLFIPPRGEGAPLSQRSLVVWRPDASYGVLAMTETNADVSGAIADNRSNRDVLHPQPMLVAPHAREQDWWIGRSGRVVIEPQNVGDSCPFGNGGGDAQDDKSGRVTCNIATFAVTLEGELLRQLDIQNTLIPEALKPRHRISITTQSVNGIRFAVRCHPTELILMTPIYSGCNASPLMFWRSDTLFAHSLGVDLRQMKNLVDRQWPAPVYGRTVLEGNERRPPGLRVLRWTMWYPDGTLAERDSTPDFPDFPTNDSPWLEQCASGMNYGGRRQCLVAAFGHPKMKSRYGVFVVDVEDVARP